MRKKIDLLLKISIFSTQQKEITISKSVWHSLWIIRSLYSLIIKKIHIWAVTHESGVNANLKKKMFKPRFKLTWMSSLNAYNKQSQHSIGYIPHEINEKYFAVNYYISAYIW